MDSLKCLFCFLMFIILNVYYYFNVYYYYYYYYYYVDRKIIIVMIVSMIIMINVFMAIIVIIENIIVNRPFLENDFSYVINMVTISDFDTQGMLNKDHFMVLSS